jgi:hypothetical protein
MAFPNVSDIIATTIESRSKKIRDNVSKNNALLAKLQQGRAERTFSGGRLIYEELAFAENSNAGWYSGYDTLPTSAQDVISAAEFAIKQAAVPVVMSGLEMLQNSGKEAMIDLMEGRINVAESTMANLISAALYSDGTANGGKQLVGLDAAVPVNPATGTYGGVDRATWTFWRSQVQSPGVALTSSNIQGYMNTLWASCTRGADRPDLIIADGTAWAVYMASLQALQRFTGTDTAKLGFPSVKFMDADVVLDGGIGGYATAKTMYFLNTKYLHWRPHSQRNMVPLSPNRRVPTNQDAEVQILAFAGNLTCSGAQFQGRLTGA